MSNITNFMENGTYNLTKIISSDMMEQPASWLVAFNSEMGGLFITGLLIAFGVGLFFVARNLDNVKDTEAALASTLVLSVMAVLLFFIEVGGDKLLTFEQLMIFLVLASVSVFANMVARRY